MSIVRGTHKEDVVYIIYTMEYYPAIRSEIMPFAATRVDLEIIKLSKPDKDKYHMNIPLMWNLIKKVKIQMNLLTK